MKKFFLFAAALFAALSVNARIIRFDGIDSADKLVAVANAAISSYTWNSGKENEYTYPAVDYTSKVGELMQVRLAGEADFEIQYKNGGGIDEQTGEIKDGHKDGILKFGKEYLQMDGKNTFLIFSGLHLDDEIQLLVSAKGSTNSKFLPEGAVADESNPASVGKADKLENYVVVKFYAEGSEVSIKETAGGYRIIALSINEDVKAAQAIDNVFSGEKAEKFFRDGQLIIRRNGVEFNAIGVKL